MTRYRKDNNGMYIIKGHKYELLEGSRAQVNNGTAYKTSGGLKKTDLLQNKNGRIVSRKKHATAKKEKRLVKAGYGTVKGKFGYVKLNGSRKSKRKMRGGKFTQSLNLSPEAVGENVENGHHSGPSAVGGSRKRKHRGGSHLTKSTEGLLGQMKTAGASMLSKAGSLIAPK